MGYGIGKSIGKCRRKGISRGMETDWKHIYTKLAKAYCQCFPNYTSYTKQMTADRINLICGHPQQICINRGLSFAPYTRKVATSAKMA